MSSLLERYWYYSDPRKKILSVLLTIFLLPLSWLFSCVVCLRRCLYRLGIKKTCHFPVPVIIVGNITVGGTGKTPFVIWLANYLREQGKRPGIVSRGMGGKMHKQPRWVREQDAVAEVGDEAILLVRRTQCPLVVCVDRVAAVRELLANADCNVVISDDGLQHYRLGRDVEIAIVDGVRQFGNGRLLPAGPLREPVTRLQEVGIIVVNGGAGDSMILQAHTWVAMAATQQNPPTPGATIHAVAAIGHPERFFATLRQQGFTLIEHNFPDHYLYQAADFNFNDHLPIVMTEKDAVKCDSFADERFWYVPVGTIVRDELKAQVGLVFLKRIK